MKRKTLINKMAMLLIAASFMVSVASCSSESSKEETTTAASETSAEETTTSEETEEAATEETSEETTTVEETETSEETTTEETTEETTVETTSETTTVETTAETTTSETKYPEADPNDPELTQLSDPEVRSIARWYLDNGYKLEFMGHDEAISCYGEGTNADEGFLALAETDSLFTIDHVVKFPDRAAADAFITDFCDSDYKPVVVTENPDGTVSLDIANGFGEGTLSLNNVLVIVLGIDPTA